MDSCVVWAVWSIKQTLFLGVSAYMAPPSRSAVLFMNVTFVGELKITIDVESMYIAPPRRAVLLVNVHVVVELESNINVALFWSKKPHPSLEIKLLLNMFIPAR